MRDASSSHKPAIRCAGVQHMCASPASRAQCTDKRQRYALCRSRQARFHCAQPHERGSDANEANDAKRMRSGVAARERGESGRGDGDRRATETLRQLCGVGAAAVNKRGQCTRRKRDVERTNRRWGGGDDDENTNNRNGCGENARVPVGGDRGPTTMTAENRRR